MAIPIRTTITCPTCATSEDVTFGDVSIGPRGRTSEAPRYSMFTNPLWDQIKRGGDTYLTCTTCGEVEFTTLARIAPGGADSKRMRTGP